MDPGVLNLLAELKLDEISTTLKDETLLSLEEKLTSEGRPKFLQHLASLGVSKLAHRQGLAGGLAKAKREGRFGELSGRPPLKVLYLHGFANSSMIGELQVLGLEAGLRTKVEMLQGFVKLDDEQIRYGKGMDEDMRSAGLAGEIELFSYYAVKNEPGQLFVNMPKRLEDFTSAADRVIEHIVEQGGYDGIVGFSQGATMSLMVAERIAEVHERCAARKLRFIGCFGVGYTAYIARGFDPAAGSLSPLDGIFLSCGSEDHVTNGTIIGELKEKLEAGGAPRVATHVSDGVTHRLPPEGDGAYAALRDLIDKAIGA